MPAALCSEDPAWRLWLLKEQRLHEVAANTILHYLPKLKQQAISAIKEGCTELNQLSERDALYSGTSVALDSCVAERLKVLESFLPPILPVSYAARALYCLAWVSSAIEDSVMELGSPRGHSLPCTN